MDSGICSCRFENEGKYFSLLTPDGRLKVWDCVSGKIKHDVTPGSHLGASKLTCFSWRASSKFRADQKKRRKRKSGDETPSEHSSHIGLGSAAGSIFIFDVLSGEIKNSLEGGHNARVNGLDWNHKSDLLYSCSDDRYIAEWSVSTQEIKCKWKGDKTSVSSIQVSPKGDTLLSAGRDIRLWDLEKKEILKKFTGHETSVSHLLFTPLRNSPSSENKADNYESDGYYFLSGAREDRFLSAWKVDLESRDKSSIVSFSLSDGPTSMELTHHPKRDKPLHLIVVSKDGQLHLFQQTLNGHLKKPVKPNTTLQLATPGTKDTTPEPVPIICATFVDGTDPSMLIAYGSPAKPQFEVLKYEELEKNVCLVRDYKCGLLLREENNNQRTPNTNKAQIKQSILTTLSTENMALARPSCGDSGSGTRKTKAAASVESPASQELSMEDRLKTMDLTAPAPEQPKSGRQSTPKAGSMTQMVIQALNSQDRRLLEDVLSSSPKETVIQNTVKRLPVNYLIPFVTELIHKIQATPTRGVQLVPWIKSVMNYHMSYLTSVPNLVETLGSLYQLFESRVTVYSRLCKLQGRLDVMLSQVSAQTQEIVEEEQLAEPLTVYKEESDEILSEGDSDHNSEDSTESMKGDVSDDDALEDEEKAMSSETEEDGEHKDEEEDIASDIGSSADESEDEMQ